MIKTAVVARERDDATAFIDDDTMGHRIVAQQGLYLFQVSQRPVKP